MHKTISEIGTEDSSEVSPPTSKKPHPNSKSKPRRYSISHTGQRETHPRVESHAKGEASDRIVRVKPKKVNRGKSIPNQVALEDWNNKKQANAK